MVQNYISEFAVLLFQAQPCVSLLDNSFQIQRAIATCFSLCCLLTTSSSGALLFLDQQRSPNEFVIICFLLHVLIMAFRGGLFPSLSCLLDLVGGLPFWLEFNC